MSNLLVIIKTIVTHRATYRFLVVLGSALGSTLIVQYADQLEASLCAMAGGCY